MCLTIPVLTDIIDIAHLAQYYVSFLTWANMRSFLTPLEMAGIAALLALHIACGAFVAYTSYRGKTGRSSAAWILTGVLLGPLATLLLLHILAPTQPSK